jgi:hypothetical protein
MAFYLENISHPKDGQTSIYFNNEKIRQRMITTAISFEALFSIIPSKERIVHLHLALMFFDP